MTEQEKKDKAEDLILKFSIFPDGNNEIVRQCAIIAVNEILSIIPMYKGDINPDWVDWNDVKNEIRNYK